MALRLIREDGQVLTFDLVLSPTIDRRTTITSHPVEDGVQITDHVQREPLIISVVGEISETPWGAMVNQEGVTDGLTGPARVNAALDFLATSEGLLMSADTGRYGGTYDNLHVARYPLSYDQVRRGVITLELREVLIAQGGTVVIPPEAPIEDIAADFADESDVGDQATTSIDNTTTDAANVSVLAALLG